MQFSFWCILAFTALSTKFIEVQYKFKHGPKRSNKDMQTYNIYAFFFMGQLFDYTPFGSRGKILEY